MIHISKLTGNKIKKLIGAKRVRKTYDNRQKAGTGNFGFVIIMPPNDWYRIDGLYGSEGYVYDLRAHPYGSSFGTQKEISDMQKINAALDALMLGMENIPKPVKSSMTISEVKKLERQNVQLRRGWVPNQQIDLIHYYILEDANFHTLNNQLTKAGKFGKFRRDRNSRGGFYYTPLGYGKKMVEARFRYYQKLGGRTWQL